MILSHRTDFAFRTLTYLGEIAQEGSVGRIASAQIAKAFGVPLNHLVKVIHELAQRGYIRTSRGPGGGVELARSPSDILLGQVIEDFQGPIRLHNHIDSPGICAIESTSKLQDVFRQADQLQRDFLNGFTLADILPNSIPIQAFDPGI